MSQTSAGDFTPQKGKRRSQRSFLESLSIAKSVPQTSQTNKNKNNQNDFHFVDSKYGIICSYSVHEMKESKPLGPYDKDISKSRSCCLENPNPTIILTPFVVLALNTEKFINYNLSQIPGIFDASAAVPLQIKISEILYIKQEVCDFALEKNLQVSTILIAFSLFDRLIMLHHIPIVAIKASLYSVLYISAQINEECQLKDLFLHIIDGPDNSRRVFNYIEAIVFLKLNCKLLPSNEEYTSYEQIARPTFLK